MKRGKSVNFNKQVEESNLNSLEDIPVGMSPSGSMEGESDGVPIRVSKLSNLRLPD
jgi:hypothetical protein